MIEDLRSLADLAAEHPFFAIFVAWLLVSVLEQLSGAVRDVLGRRR